MSGIDCLATIQDPVTGEPTDVVRVPAGYVVCLMSREDAERFSDWTECAAVRIAVDEDDTIASLEVSNDLEWLTGPEAERAG